MRSALQRSDLLVALAALLIVAGLLAPASGAASGAGSGGPAGWLYVANLRSDTLIAIDVAAGVVRDRWPMAASPNEVARTDSGRVWVSNYFSEHLSELDPASGAIQTRPTTPRPHGLALDGAGAVWYTAAGGTIAALGSATAIAVGDTPHALAIDTTRGRAYVAVARSGTIVAVDLVASAVVAEATVGAITESLALSPDGGTLVAAAADAGVIALFDAPALRERVRVTVDSRPVRVALTPTLVLASLANGEVAIFARPDLRPLGRVAVGRLPDGIAVDAAARFAYVSNAGEASISVIDLARLAVVATLPADDGPSGIVWTPTR